jgi:hypothetical protein
MFLAISAFHDRFAKATTAPTSVGPYIQVTVGVWMTVWAMTFERMAALSRKWTALHVLGMRYSFEMERINAAACTTLVIKFAVFWNGVA